RDNLVVGPGLLDESGVDPPVVVLTLCSDVLRHNPALQLNALLVAHVHGLGSLIGDSPAYSFRILEVLFEISYSVKPWRSESWSANSSGRSPSTATASSARRRAGSTCPRRSPSRADSDPPSPWC